MGGSSSKTEVYQPTPPPQPTTADSLDAWRQSAEAAYQLQLKYAPQEAAQNLQLLQQYGTQTAQAYKDANDALYPETAALQEQLANQASEGMSGQVPDWMADQYRSELNANLGTNAGSGIGADYLSRGMLDQTHGYKQYYQNLGLSLAGRQPLAQAGQPQTTNFMGQNTLGGHQNFLSSNYGTYAGASRPMTLRSSYGGFNSGAGGMIGKGIGGLLGGWASKD